MLRKRLQELGHALPEASAPLASYTPARVWQGAVYVSGQLPLKKGELLLTGPMTADRSIEEAQNAMAQCFLNGLAAAVLVADLDRIVGVLKLGAYVASAPDFTGQHKVANGASDLARDLFGEVGVHTRFAVGAAALPLGATVELELILVLAEH